MTDTEARPRCAAIVGPYLSGKTTLFEALLFATGAIHRKGTAKEKNTVGDSSPEARAREMGVEVSAASAEFLGDPWTFLDCPGSIEFAQEAFNALMVADAAVVVCEPLIERALTLAPLLKFLDDHRIPHLLFINKMDGATARVREVIEALQGVSQRPLVVRHMPIREGESITGYVDLVSERAYHYKPGEPSELVTIPDSLMDREQAERTELLESLADFDDALLEQLLEDVVPPKEEVYRHLTRVLQEDLVVPVLLGAAEQDHGVRRLLKALRHEVPGPEETAGRRGLTLGNDGAPTRSEDRVGNPRRPRSRFSSATKASSKRGATESIPADRRSLSSTKSPTRGAAASSAATMRRRRPWRTASTTSPRPRARRSTCRRSAAGAVSVNTRPATRRLNRCGGPS